MKAQYRDGDQWVDLPAVDYRVGAERLASEYCKQNGLHTRVVTMKEGKEEVVREFTLQTKRTMG